MKLSIAMATYNGEKYIEEQILSFANQIRPPDELVVCDDQSSDRTLEIVNGLRERVSFPIHAVRNHDRLGYIHNFSKAVQLCTGDIVFLSDQDDVWDRRKLKEHEDVYLRDESIVLVFNDLQVVDTELKPLGTTMFRLVDLDDRLLEEIEGERAMFVLTKRTRVSGCAVSFRAGIWKHVLPVPENFYHDEWVAMIAAMMGRIKAIREPLNLYRQHSSQTLGVDIFKQQQPKPPEPATWTRQQWLEKNAIYRAAMLHRIKRLEDDGVALTCKDFQDYTRGHVAHLWRRVSFPKSLLRRLPMCLAELLLGNYARYNESVKDTLSYDLRPQYFKNQPR